MLVICLNKQSLSRALGGRIAIQSPTFTPSSGSFMAEIIHLCSCNKGYREMQRCIMSKMLIFRVLF